MGMDIDAVGGKDVASNNDLHNMILNIEFVCLCVCVCVYVCVFFCQFLLLLLEQ